METLKIGEREIGAQQPCFIIAEAGVNHNGRLDLALQLVDAALAAGADAVKFQTWITEKVLTPDAPLAEYQKRNLNTEETQFEMAKRLELSPHDFSAIKDHADSCGITFFSTPDEEESADFLEELGIGLFKISSAEVNNLSFLSYVARKGKPVILSTGMATLAEVALAVEAIRQADNDRFALLHCVTDYPAPAATCNLRAMNTMRGMFQCPVGFSDHTMGNHISVAAAAMGASIIEKHLTLDRQLPGPDHRASLDPREFAEFVRVIREAESAMGNGVKEPVSSELRLRKIVRKVVVAAQDLPVGRVLQSGDLVLRRAIGGGAPSDLARFVGKRAIVKISKHDPVRSDMLA